jgi:hypothetical protein
MKVLSPRRHPRPGFCTAVECGTDAVFIFLGWLSFVSVARSKQIDEEAVSGKQTSLNSLLMSSASRPETETVHGFIWHGRAVGAQGHSPRCISVLKWLNNVSTTRADVEF